MEENEYDKALEAILKEMRINLNRRDSSLLINEKENYQQPPMRPYHFERPQEDDIMALAFIVKDDVTKEDLDIDNIDMHLNPLYKKVGSDVNVDISNYFKIFLKEVKDLNNISKDQLYLVETSDGLQTSAVMLSKNHNVLTIISLRPSEPDIEIFVDDIDVIYEVIHCKLSTT